MPTTKRRRAIDIPESVYQLLKQESEKRGYKTPTSLLSKILTGEASPLEGNPDLHVPKTHSVSMTEALWLAFRVRKNQFDDVPMKIVASWITLGHHTALKDWELIKGEAEAAQREQDRIGRTEAKPENKKVKKEAPQMQEVVQPVSQPDAQADPEANQTECEKVEPIKVQEAEKEPVLEPEYTATDDEPEIEESEDSKPILQPPVETKMVERSAISEQEEFYGGVKLF